MTDPAPVFILTEREYRNAVEYLLDHMAGFDPNVYRADIPRVGLDQVALDDWRNVWTQGDEVRDSEDAALEALNAPDAYGPRYNHVLTLILDDVREALRQQFGATNGLG